MANAIRIKRSSVTASPVSLQEGELAYSELSNNLYIGTNSGSSIAIIGGRADHDKLAGIQAGAQVNAVLLDTNTFTGKQIFSAVSASAASFLLPNGSTNPTIPVTGDFWANGSLIKWYNGVSTKTLAFSDSNITGTAGNVTGIISAINGGTGTGSYTAGDILYASTGTALSKLSDVATGNVIISGGVGVAPSYGKVGLTTHVSGNLPITNGGTGSGSQTANRLVTTDGTGNIVSLSGVTSTEAGYLSGLTSSIQSQLGTKANINNPTFTGVVTLSQNPTNPLEAATKQYVDGIAQGLDFKNSVICASTAQITLSNAQTVDGIVLVQGDRILVKDQTNAYENGIYVVNASGIWARSEDANTSNEVTTGLFVYVEKGSQGGYSYVLGTQGVINLGVTNLSFAQFGGGVPYSAGTGIQISGGSIALNASGFNASYITAGTISDARLSANVLVNTSSIDGGSF
jgi:hypothetical protein